MDRSSHRDRDDGDAIHARAVHGLFQGARFTTDLDHGPRSIDDRLSERSSSRRLGPLQRVHLQPDTYHLLEVPVRPQKGEGRLSAAQAGGERADEAFEQDRGLVGCGTEELFRDVRDALNVLTRRASVWVCSLSSLM